MTRVFVYYISKATYKLMDGILIGFGIHMAWHLIG